ncbi:hypothetical protein LTR40_006185 [Exophiala xenobiotica]|nr:hypothetical protein LTR40_006185 [Exophiala xenobiotica]
MATHAAVVTVGPGLPLEIHQVPTPTPTENQVRVKSEWTASTPLDLHEADGGLLVKHPQGLGDGVAGTVVEIGSDVTRLKVGDKVFGFTWRGQAEKAHQEFVVAPEYLFGKLPNGVTMQQAVTLPNNFVTVWHTLTKDFGFELPWPKPEGYTPEGADQGILVWGGSSSVGQYALQVLKWYGYRNVIATASKHHHEKLQRYGAVNCFDYRDTEVIKSVSDFASSQAGAKVAILLPVIVKDAAKGVKPEYEMDVKRCASWQSGVEAVGVRTHFYLENKFLADKLQPEIMPTLLGNGIVEPNEQVIVEGKTMLERAEKALSMLRDKKISGARLVWKVSDS